MSRSPVVAEVDEEPDDTRLCGAVTDPYDSPSYSTLTKGSI